MRDRAVTARAGTARAGIVAVLVALAAAAILACAPRGADRHDPGAPPAGMEAVRQLRYPPLRFDPPEPERFTLSNGVTVFFLRDPALPLVDLFVLLRGGYVHFERAHYGAASGLPSLMRGGGTRHLDPDSLDALLDFHALGLGTSTDGGRILLSTRSLRRHMDRAVELWSEALLHPRFDSAAVERWRVREVEAVRRAAEFPGSLAVREFNRLAYGDHPTGWALTEADLTPDRVTPDRLRDLHRATVCPERAVIGAAGDITRQELEAALERVLGDWAPCDRPHFSPPAPTLTADPSIYVIPLPVSQSTIVVGQPGGVRMGENRDYFASRVADWVLGGSGTTSRLFVRVRTEEGLAYSAASVWGSARDHERILGAITHTRGERTVDATRLVLETLRDARRHPPTDDEVRLARDAMSQGFLFGFGSAAQIVARQVNYLADDLPADWLTRYFDGVRAVRTAHVADVLRRHLDPDAFTILIVGDTARFDPGELGDYTLIPPP